MVRLPANVIGIAPPFCYHLIHVVKNLVSSVAVCCSNSVITFLFFCSCHKRFSQLDPEAVRANKNAKLPSRKIMALPELRVCTFV